MSVPVKLCIYARVSFFSVRPLLPGVGYCVRVWLRVCVRACVCVCVCVCVRLRAFARICLSVHEKISLVFFR